MQVFLNSLLLNFESRRSNNSVGNRVPLSTPGCLEFAPRNGRVEFHPLARY